jgi:hypothetical protein
MTRTLHTLAAAAALCLAAAGTAQAAPVTFTKLTGLTGDSPAGTAVFKADLSAVGLASILSISIADNSFGLGGAGGQFSGFDLDAIKLSTADCATAACASGLAGLSVFDFFSGIIFAPGVQRAPVDPKLFGTDAAGTGVDNAVATLGAFDADSTTVTPDGFLSLGDGGVISFNLTGAVSTAGLFLRRGRRQRRVGRRQHHRARLHRAVATEHGAGGARAGCAAGRAPPPGTCLRLRP